MNTQVNLAGIKMKNPITVASGTFGYGGTYQESVFERTVGIIFCKNDG